MILPRKKKKSCNRSHSLAPSANKKSHSIKSGVLLLMGLARVSVVLNIADKNKGNQMKNTNREVVVSKEEKKVALVDNTPKNLIRLAIEKGASLTEVEKLLTIQERYEANEALKSFNEAMSAFKANAPKIVKDKKVGYEAKGQLVGYKHASLFQVVEKTATEMSKHGLSVSWRVAQNGTISVTTRVVHVKGHFEETTLSAPADTTGSKNSIQAIGSTISYLQRYGLLCIAGLATVDMDDDGVSAVTEYINDKELSQITDMVDEYKVDEAKFLSYMKIESLSKMPKAKFNQAISALQQKAKK